MLGDIFLFVVLLLGDGKHSHSFITTVTALLGFIAAFGRMKCFSVWYTLSAAFPPSDSSVARNFNTVYRCHIEHFVQTVKCRGILFIFSYILLLIYYHSKSMKADKMFLLDTIIPLETCHLHFEGKDLTVKGSLDCYISSATHISRQES